MDNDIIHSDHNNAGTDLRPPGQPSQIQSEPNPPGTAPSASTRTPLPSSSLAGWDSRGGIADAKEAGEEQGSLSSSSSSSESDPYWLAMEAKEFPNPSANEGLLWKKQGGMVDSELMRGWNSSRPTPGGTPVPIRPNPPMNLGKALSPQTYPETE